LHAELDYTGHRWECARGYTRVGDGCSAVQLPEHAELDYSGHRWECGRGYYRSDDRCFAVQLPANASLDYSGHGWTCDDGFVKRVSKCVSIALATDSEIRRVLISQSLASYPGNCPCPWNADRAGRSCGGRSAYSRAGGYSPRCYDSDISDAEVQALRRRYKP
jgi:hypothetical protein